MVTIVDYRAGNLVSVKRALDYLGIENEITAEPERIAAAERIIFPGVGNAATALPYLRESGIAAALTAAAEKGTPILGICLGMQIMMSDSDEGGVKCLNFFKGGVRKLAKEPGLKIPHMGWNGLGIKRGHPVFAGVAGDAEFYFVHSYYVAPEDGACVIATATHGREFVAAIGRDNLVATQFHPEKSGEAGLKILKNFCGWDGRAVETPAAREKAKPGLSKRMVACLDVRNGNLAKSIKFVNTKEIGDPVAAAAKYYAGGADELVLYDINASHEKRDIMLGVVERVAGQVFIPFSVGGGLRTLDDCVRVIAAGAEKIHLNSNAVTNPELIAEVAARFGTQCMILSVDVLRTEKRRGIPSGFEIVINGGRKETGLDAIEWIKRGVELGAGEVVVNSIDRDGMRDGYDLGLTGTVADTVDVPVVASGGAGAPEHIAAVLTDGGADAALVSSIIHYNQYTINELKDYLTGQGIKMRKTV